MQKNSRRAYSLIELSIVILIISTLVGLIATGARLLPAHRLYSARALTRSGPVQTIPNLAFWVDASSEGAFLNQISSTEMSSNDAISSWTEPNYLTRARRTCLQATAADRPTYLPTALNGLPVARFSATASTSMSLACTADSGMNTENTIFVVFVWNASYSGGTSNFLVIGNNNPLTLNSVSTAGDLNFYSYNGSNIDELHYTLKAGRAYLTTRWSNPATNSSILYVNGSNAASSTATLNSSSTTYTSLDTDTLITIGNYPGVARPFGGDIAEIIIYDRALNNEERQSVEKYLAKKWQIKLN